MIILVILFAASVTASTQPLVLISDIDDTLKASDIVGLTNAGLSNAKRMSAALKSSASSRNAFTGLSLLYTAFACGAVENDFRNSCHAYRAHNRGSERMVFYVTGAPNKLAGFSLRFLLNAEFPLGPVLPRESTDVSTREHKVEAITRIIEHLPPSTIILVGDNGEHDVEVFARVRREFADRSGRYLIKSFVHQVASANDPDPDLRGTQIGEDQIAFVTAADLGLHFFTNHWIEASQATEVLRMVESALAGEESRSRVIPAWINCTGFRFPTPENLRGIQPGGIVRTVDSRCRTGQFPGS